MDFLLNWLTGNMGTEGEYMYTSMHFITLGIVLFITAFFAILGASKMDDKTKRKILKGVCVFQLSFEVFWRILYIIFNMKPAAEYWPMFPCNLGGILIPLFGLLNLKKGKQMFYLFGLVGACLTFSMPEGIFNNSVYVFPIVKSILQHTGLLIIPVFEYTSGSYRQSIKDFPWTVAGCFIHLFNCEVFDRWLGLTGDYMFYQSGLPFVIPGVSQYITLSVFGLLVMLVLSYITGIRESNRTLRGLFKKK